MKYRIILASASKRRSKILKECGIKHEVVISGVSEEIDNRESPKVNVLLNAQAKGRKVASKYTQGFIVSADTVVLVGKRLLGKPRTKKEAKEFLKLFSGKTLFVYTGLCVFDAKKQVAVGEVSHDKAGGFSIEGPGTFIFDDIQGSFYNILGLPMHKLNYLFRKLGVDLLEEVS